MQKRSDEILEATLQVARTVDPGGRFRASKVRDHLGLPQGPDTGTNEPIRECWRQNRDWLKARGLRLEEVKKTKRSWWYLIKEFHV